MFDLNRHVARLLMDEPFFTVLSRNLEKKRTDQIPTAGVRINKETAQYELFYNADFFEKLTDNQRKNVLLHEFYHCVFEHVTGRLPENAESGKKEMTKIWNIATDLAINSHLDDLPDGCVKPGYQPFEDYPSGMAAEWYLEKMKEDNKDQEVSEGQQFDEHGEWSDVDEDIKAMAKQRMKESIKKAAQEAAQNGNWGSVTNKVRKDIMDRIQTKIDWRKTLRYFIKTSQKANKSSSMKSINRRYPYIHAGKKTSRTAKVAIAIDQSGSVSDAMLNAFFNELNNLAKYAEFTVIPFDTEVDDSLVYNWKKGEKRRWERQMSGGTCFDAPTDYVNAGSFDGMIILSDLCAPKPKRCKVQRMWITTTHYAQRPYFDTGAEKVIAIDA